MIIVPLAEQITNNLISSVVVFSLLMLYKPKYKAWQVVTAYLVLFYILNYAASAWSMTDMGKDTDNTWITFCFHAVSVIFGMCCFKAKKLYVLFNMILIIILTFVSSFFAYLFSTGFDWDINKFPDVFILDFLYLSFYYFSFVLILKISKRKKVYSSSMTYIFTIVPTLVWQYTLCIILPMIYSYSSPVRGFVFSKGILSNYYWLLSIYLLLSLLVNIGLVMIINKTRKYYDLKYQSEFADAKSDAIAENIKKIDSDVAQTRQILCQCNDAIEKASGFIDTGSTENASETLEGAEKMLNSVYNKQYCSNPLINIILANKLAKCATDFEESIMINLPEKLGIEDIDLCRIISNLCDNALNALEKVGDGLKYLEINMYCEQDMVYVKFKNTFSPNAVSEKSKEHGFGLVILKDIAEKYNGRFITESSKDNIFSALFVAENVNS